MPIPLRGDRSAWDTGYPHLHAKDIEDDISVYHLPSGAVFGDVPVWTGTKWETQPASGSGGSSGSGGDMYRATYDTDMDGIVDAAETAPWAGITGKPSTFAPSAHASSHAAAGGDPVKLDDLYAPDDNTDLNASTSKHGLLPKLGGGTSNFLRADGTWASPSSADVKAAVSSDDTTPDYLENKLVAGSNITLTVLNPGGNEQIRFTVAGPMFPSAHAFTHISSGSDPLKLDDLALPDDNTDLDASATRHGLLPKLGGGTTNFLRADGAWAAPPTASPIVAISSNDTTPDYLENKVVAGTNISLAILNEGGNEQIRITSSGSALGSGAVDIFEVQFYT